MSALVFLTSGCASWPAKVGKLPSAREAIGAQKQVEQYAVKRDQALLQAARSRLDQGDEKGCRTLIEQLLSRSPQHVGGRLTLADLCLLEDRPDQAKEIVEAVLTEHPNHAAALHAMGALLSAEGDDLTAKNYFQRAAEIEPNNNVYQLSYQHSLDGLDGAAPTGVPVFASDARTEKLAAAATDAEAARLMVQGGMALESAAPDEARQLFAEAFRREPNNPYLPLHAALEAIRRKQTPLALEILDAGVACHPHSSPLLRLHGAMLYQQGQYQNAQKALQGALAANEHDALAHFLLGQTLSRLGQPNDAAASFAAAGRLDPTLLQR